MRRREHKSESGFLSIIGIYRRIYRVSENTQQIVSSPSFSRLEQFPLFFFFLFLSTKIASRESGNRVTDCFHTREMSFSLNFFFFFVDEKSWEYCRITILDKFDASTCGFYNFTVYENSKI